MSHIIDLHQYFTTPEMADGIHSFGMARDMGENGRRWVEEKYSWQVSCRKLDYLYQQVLTAPVVH